MGKYGGKQYARDTRSELRRRRFQAVPYVALAALAVATAAVVVIALKG
ncbi:hypothetical protein [Pseudarthrobacter cellobiosi]|nr:MULTISPECIES: hypothetical protein [unclassified Pseudarthrobacter]MCO4276526.1 hypothetical protein [Pseudarthrobacter sp. HLT3-5]